MAGSNVILKSGQTLFREGDKSDGMYLVRRGELLIYLEKGGSEVKLAKVTAGAMIGEMALFDQKPRSASAKALSEVEITKISNEDFKKIMKQIPKWFVSLMTSLSTRLRETNERLQKTEAQQGAQRNPLEDLQKIVGILGLLWHKDGTKEAKSWLLERDPAELEVHRILGFPKDKIHKIIQALIESRLIGCKPNSYKKDVLFVPNRGETERFLSFTSEFAKNHPGKSSLSDPAMELLLTLGGMAAEAAYDSVTISLSDLCLEGEKQGANTTEWKNVLDECKQLGPGVSLVKVSDGIGFKVSKKDFSKLVDQYKILQKVGKASF